MPASGLTAALVPLALDALWREQAEAGYRWVSIKSLPGFTDAKAQWQALVDANGHILWTPDVTDAQTR